MTPRFHKLAFCLAAATAVVSACATVVEETPDATATVGGPDTGGDLVGPVSNTAQATGPGNTTTINNTSSASTSAGAGNNTTSNTTGSATSGGVLGNAGNTVNTTSGSTTTSGTTTGSSNTTTGGTTTGSSNTSTTTTTTTGTVGGAGGAGNTGTPVGGMTGMTATTGSASCEADAWESGKTTTDANGNAYSEGDLVEYMGVIYSVDQDQNYGHPDCPPDGSGETWCSTQYSFTPVDGC